MSLENVLFKYYEIIKGGSVNNLGRAEEFRGFPESLDNRFNAAVLFSPASVNQIRARLTDPLENLETQLGMKLVIVGRDFPLHTTILEADYIGKDPEERQTIYDGLKDEVANVMARLNGLNIEYDRLIVDKGGNVIAVATQIPQEVVEIRRELAEIYARHGLKPKTMDNILHSTIARLEKIPKSDDGLRKFRMLGKLKSQIKRNHLKLVASNMHIGSALDFMPDKMKASHSRWKKQLSLPQAV